MSGAPILRVTVKRTRSTGLRPLGRARRRCCGGGRGGVTSRFRRCGRPSRSRKSWTGASFRRFTRRARFRPEREYPIRTSTAGLAGRRARRQGRRREEGPAAGARQRPGPGREGQAGGGGAGREAGAGRRRRRRRCCASSTRRSRFTKEMVEIADREQQRLRGLLETQRGDADRPRPRARPAQARLDGAGELAGAARREAAGAAEGRRRRPRRVEAAKENAKQQTLVSPIDGVVLDRRLASGTRLAVNDHVMRIADVRRRTSSCGRRSTRRT